MDQLFFQNTQIMRLACGVKHTALITTKGELICFGSNEYGQCGDGKSAPDLMKKSFDINIYLRGKAIESIACGGAHTLVKTSI
jgi:alpha-tubulin suppressor-like RCC1 family protein